MPKLNILGDPSHGSTYDNVSGTISRIAIFPPIGIARVGDSDKDCFLAPEVPGRTSPPKGLLVNGEFKFRDADQKLRRQAVRFRVYAYDNEGKLLGELNTENGYTLTWNVNVANKKAANVIFQRGGRFGPSDNALRNPNVRLDDRSHLIVQAEGKIKAEPSQTPGQPSTTPSSGIVPLNDIFRRSENDNQVTVVELAQLQVDTAGRLVFVPGRGDARSIASPGKPHPRVTSEFDNADWIDEICDGSVGVTVKKGDTELTVPLLAATVLSAPPNFAWGINAPTTLYDIMENIYYENPPLSPSPPHVPAPTANNLDFWKHIWPVLLSTSSMSWTNNTARQGHGEGDSGKKEKRKHFKSWIFEKLRKPLDEANIDQSQADVRYMPRISGDAGGMADSGEFPRNMQPDARRFAALTKLQYERFKIWKDNDAFYLKDDATGKPPIPDSKLENIKPIGKQPRELTRAILESTIGDPLFPGIEMYWIAKLKTTYDTSVTSIDPPFRIRIKKLNPTNPTEPEPILPGHLTRGLSLPWQCDFDQCNTHWWPAIRPDDVVPRLVFGTIVQSSRVKEDFNTAITTRTKWKRGLRETVFYSASQKDWPGSDDMIRYWTHLGIVREVKDAFTDDSTPPKKYTAFLEEERVSV